MSKRESPLSERDILGALVRQTFQRKCVVIVDHCTWTGHECDALAVTRCLRIIDIEVKVSRGDLRADARKDKWWHRPWGYPERPPAVAREWPPHVWKHYYALPESIWSDDLLPCLPSKRSGVITVARASTARVIATVRRRATPNGDAQPISAAACMDIARLAGLRMWDAYAEIDRLRLSQPGDFTPPQVGDWP